MAAHEDDQTEDGPSDSKRGRGPDEAPELGEALDEIEDVESQRRLWGAVIGTATFLLLAAAVFAVVRFRTTLFRPPVDLETERETIRKTDDPECRQMIADVTAIKHEFFSLEDEIAATMPDGDPTAIRSLLSELEKLQRRIDEAEKLSQDATLRFDEDRKQLDDWFEYVDYEIGIVVQIAETRLEKKTGAPGGTADAGDVGGGGSGAGDAGRSERDAGDAGGDAGGSNLVRERKEAVAAVHRVFENFRVWHEGGRHPCGAAESDETPWRPDDWGDAGSIDGGVTDEEDS